MSNQFDLIIIGAGPGGYVAAIRAAQRGLHTALVEARDLGGTCLNRGCIPTKALLHSSGLYRELREGAEMGILTEGLRYDLDTMYRRKDAVVSELREGIALLLEANAVQHYHARARLESAQSVRLDDASATLLQAPHILLATGAAPALPPIPGITLPRVHSSDRILNGETPLDCKRLAILGGGVIGTELASFYENLGCSVTILEAADRLLPTADREISQNLGMIFKKRGIAVHTGSSVQEITETPEGLAIHFTDKKGEAGCVETEHLLISIGRRAQLAGLWDESLPIEAPRGILVNERFETTLPGVYAIGDCVEGGIQLAHLAAAQATNVIAAILGEPPEIDLSLVPGCIYTNPEIAWVGLSADEAKRDGRAVKTSKYVMSGNGKSMIERQDRGFVKLVFDAETAVLLGAQLMCGRATDLIGTLTASISAGRSAEDLATLIHPHPTFSEGLGEAVEALFSRAVHVAPKRKPR